VLTASIVEEEMDFGAAVAIDQDILVAGAGRLYLEAGRAFVFQRQEDGQWIETQVLEPSDGDIGDEFGFAVALDDTTAVIGAHQNYNVNRQSGTQSFGAGSVYIFKQGNNGVWNQTQKIVNANGTSSDWFGGHVAIDGNLMVVGESNAQTTNIYMRSNADANFVLNATLVSMAQVDQDRFGFSVDIYEDTVVVGAPGGLFYNENIVGYAVVFQRAANNTWGTGFTLRPNDGVIGDEFGHSVAIFNSTIVIANGVTGSEGVSYIFERTDPSVNVWNQTQKIQFGFAVAMNENFIVADKTVYHRSPQNNTWVKHQEEELVSASDGSTVYLTYAAALSGNVAVLGKPDVNNATGSVGVFEFVGTPMPSTTPSTTPSSVPSTAPSAAEPSPVATSTKAPVSDTKQTSRPSMMEPEETITITKVPTSSAPCLAQGWLGVGWKMLISIVFLI